MVQVIYRKVRGMLLLCVQLTRKLTACCKICQHGLFFSSSLRNCQLSTLIISYDIACQWSKNLWQWMVKFPDNYRLVCEQMSIVFLVPKFHLPAHVSHCQVAYSFNFTPHVGCTDGEVPEHGWANINPAASSTKEMGPGT